MISFSILTPTLNSVAFISEALESVSQQRFAYCEHVVIDGGSTDGTLDLLRDHHELKLLSGPDAGIYDALNKGISLAKGDVIGLLNSDDRYAGGVLAAVADQFDKDPELDVVSGAAIAFDENTGRICARHDQFDKLKLTVRNAMLEVPVINARFFRRRLFDHIGLFDLEYTLAADRELLIRVAASHPRETILRTVVYEYRMHGNSMTLDPAARRSGQLAEENMRMAERFLAKNELVPGFEPLLRRWHSEYAITAMAAGLRAMEPTMVGAAFLRGWRFDPAWPLRSLAIVAGKIGGRSIARLSR